MAMLSMSTGGAQSSSSSSSSNILALLENSLLVGLLISAVAVTALEAGGTIFFFDSSGLLADIATILAAQDWGTTGMLPVAVLAVKYRDRETVGWGAKAPDATGRTLEVLILRRALEAGTVLCDAAGFPL